MVANSTEYKKNTSVDKQQNTKLHTLKEHLNQLMENDREEMTTTIIMFLKKNQTFIISNVKPKIDIQKA